MSGKSSTLQETLKSTALTLEAGRALINRSYLGEMERYQVQPLEKGAQPFNRAGDLRVFRVERIVQDNKQSVLESTTAVYTALGAAGYTVFLYLICDGVETDLYIGTRGQSGQMLGHNSGELLREAFKGHFSGSALQPLDAQQTDAIFERLLKEKTNTSASVTAVTGVPALSTDNREHFMQGLERFIDAAERRVYQALILAESMSPRSLEQIRSGYERVATQLSPLQKMSISLGEQESDSVGMSISQSLSTSLGESLALTESQGQTQTTGTSRTQTHGTSDSLSAQTGVAKAAALAPLVGAVAGTLLGGPVGAMVGSQVGSAMSGLLNEQKTTGTSESRSEGSSESTSHTQGTARSSTSSTTRTRSDTDTHSINRTSGSTKQYSLEIQDKGIEQLLTRIDHHLKRIDEAQTYGGWQSAAYFIGDSVASSETLASLYLGLIRGNNSSHEDFALTTWNSVRKSAVIDWLSTLSHPALRPQFSPHLPITHLTPATLVSSMELSIQLSLPRRSTSTVAVVSTQAFGRKVLRMDGKSGPEKIQRRIELGNIRHLWENLPQNISLDMDQLASHVFVSGSTGAGKSNTLYEMLHQIDAENIPFLVIEPAKGEYKHVFGHHPDVQVFGTNPAYGTLLRINPFRFEAGIHILEHVDRLIEIFNVCWPMYAAMPAVLKDAILQAYSQCGWDLETSVNRVCDSLFPSFLDLLITLEQVISESAYSAELKGNYIGSLSTRIKSLTNGLNGQIFSADEIDSEILFNNKAIVDLSRIGSSETKSLIMGILVMRLSEYRMVNGGINHPLRHVTVLEEAHHLLKRNAGETGAEGGSLAGKATEMLTNAIAEMRTYGEGFIIVDQSPHAVDLAAIRNTNTKIIMRLPDEADRRLIGKSIGLKDDQLEEIARLPKGVAIVHQNDWLEPVLCQVRKFKGEERRYIAPVQQPGAMPASSATILNCLLQFLMGHRVPTPANVDLDKLSTQLDKLVVSGSSKLVLYELISARRAGKETLLMHDAAFDQLARVVVDVLGCRQQVQKLIRSAIDFPQLGDSLHAMLEQKAPGIDLAHSLATQQCLMKDFSLQKEEHVDIYAAWRTELTTRSNV
ncbi:ATP-binding protein [Herbaspirillum lusitanum]|uniref:ATP-binding protein n=1 Tax=Herbaspirillum lusitanum TaxID=213312 RepID=A0ABW9A805_9BURK